jgi:signal transduction histidine kinase
VAWPGWLVERVLSVVAAGCRLRGVRSAGAVVLAGAAAASSYASHPTLDFRVAVPLALLATAPLAVAGRFPRVSVGVALAANGPYEVPDLPAPAQAAFQEIAEEARTALTELRTILGVLRADAGTPDRPQPRLANLPELLNRMRGAGPVVTLRIQGVPRSLPESVELCGYRIVQEALTNAGQHSPGSQAEVELVYMPDALQINVRNGAPGREDAGHPRGNPVRAGGFGLLGMRERVTTLGGLFDAGPDRAGGFMVTARVPVSPPDPSSRAPE